MQFTGLRDKNGREIYDGDIVRTENAVYEVRWRVECARFALYEAAGGNYRDLPGCPSGSTTESVEVLGNIYETANLIGRQPCERNFPSHTQEAAPRTDAYGCS
jgi:hypothetical protein